MSAPFHGLLLINKEPGGTSHDLVSQVRRLLSTREVGHAGTLDPLAGGLMVLLVGEGTKLSHYILEGDKGYRVKLLLGRTTDTLDVTGTTLEEKPVAVTESQLLDAARSLEGDFEWEVPMYSAVKVQGQKLYQYARKNEDVAVPVKTMKFWGLKFHGFDGVSAEFDIQCSKGSYIRSWVAKLGEKLGCGACMSELTRTRSGSYGLDQAATIPELGRRWHEKDLSAGFVGMTQALPAVKRIRIKGQDQVLLRNGQISSDLRTSLIQQFQPGSDELIQIHSAHESELVALIGLEQGVGFKIRRVFKY